MGFGGISAGSLLIILVIVILIFGTKKLRNMGGDLGSGLKNFKDAMKEGDAQSSLEQKSGETADSQTDSTKTTDKTSP
tara:strand:+ start:197 stop:430 length:234 start_codon:yes stop_codon:yes gene_type:complete